MFECEKIFMVNELKIVQIYLLTHLDIIAEKNSEWYI